MLVVFGVALTAVNSRLRKKPLGGSCDSVTFTWIMGWRISVPFRCQILVVDQPSRPAAGLECGTAALGVVVFVRLARGLGSRRLARSVR